MKYGKVKKFFLFLIGKKRENYSTDFRPTVSVLIPAYNEEKTIANTIESIKAQTYPIEEI
ncbi:glycosyltransferase, partial [Candidatus Parcubacteria bacterium]|nr:glycosyltransferase [Candidatus Parcubacteria bacterium]